MTDYRPEKLIWSNEDFEVMGWHDATVWGLAADTEEFEYLIDLDYIFKWVSPASGENHFKFWVAPVTMVFENACDVRLDVCSQQGAIEVSDLHRELIGPSPNGRFTQYAFRFECQEGELTLQATGYKMYVRKTPSLLETQSFSLAVRGGVSFSREQ